MFVAFKICCVSFIPASTYQLLSPEYAGDDMSWFNGVNDDPARGFRDVRKQPRDSATKSQ